MVDSSEIGCLASVLGEPLVGQFGPREAGTALQILIDATSTVAWYMYSRLS
jgi:hypothetical protein